MYTHDTQIAFADGSYATAKDTVEGFRLHPVKGVRDGVVVDSGIFAAHEQHYRGQVLRVTSENGHSCTITPATNLLTIADGVEQWIPAGNLRAGDYVAMPYGYRTPAAAKPSTFVELLVDLGVDDVVVGFSPEASAWRTVEELVKKDVALEKQAKYLDTCTAPLPLVAKVISSLAGDVVSICGTHGCCKPFPNFPVDKRWWYFVGLMLGDGAIAGSKIKLCQTPKKDVDFIMRDIFPFVTMFEPEQEKETYQPTFSNSVMAAALAKLGCRNGEPHRLLFAQPADYINALIAGYWDTDGCFSEMFDKKTGKINLRTVLSSANKGILVQISAYLNSIGVLNSLYTAAGRDVTDLSISNKCFDEFDATVGAHIRMRKEKKDSALRKYKEQRDKYSIDGDVLPVSSVVRNLSFPRGAKNTLLKEEGIDVWNYCKVLPGRDGVPRQKLETILCYVLSSPERAALERLVATDLTWVKVRSVDAVDFEGSLCAVAAEGVVANGFVTRGEA